MKILCMHKTDAASEAGLPPRPELLAGIGPLTEAMTRAGVLVSTDGLRPTASGVRLRYEGGVRVAVPGPFEGENELLAGFAIVRAKSLDEAIRWADRFAEIVGDAELDLRPVCESWDLGFEPRPPGLDTTRFMIAHKADAVFESGAVPSAAKNDAMTRLVDEMRAAGVLLATVGLQPSSRSKRIQLRRGRRKVIDGPFAESKELIAGFALLDVPTVQDAIDWSWRFAELLGEAEIDLRPVAGSDL